MILLYLTTTTPIVITATTTIDATTSAIIIATVARMWRISTNRDAVEPRRIYGSRNMRCPQSPLEVLEGREAFVWKKLSHADAQGRRRIIIIIIVISNAISSTIP